MIGSKRVQFLSNKLSVAAIRPSSRTLLACLMHSTFKFKERIHATATQFFQDKMDFAHNASEAYKLLSNELSRLLAELAPVQT